MREQRGMVYLVGAGPGAPGLITVEGSRLVSQAEVLVYDRLASQEFLKAAPDSCERIYVGKEAGRHSRTQEEINEILVKKALEGRLVVRLKGGDPFVFGRGGEEILELERHKIPYQVVPGVTSAIAALSHAGIPVTHRLTSQSFHVITGHTAMTGDSLTGGFEEYAKLKGTLIFLMGLSNLERIAGELIKYGKSPDTPAAVVTDGTLPQERCVRASLKELPEAVRRAGLKPPGIIAVGETAGFSMTCERERLLSGLTVGVTGTDGIFEKLSAKLSSMGAKIVRAGRSYVEPENEELLFEALKELSSYGWIVFTSRNAAALFFDAMKKRKIDLRSLGHIKFAVVGKGTGEFLSSFGFYPDLMPEEYTVKALAEELVRRAALKERILIPRAKQGSKILTNLLSDGGFSFLDLPIYDIKTENEPFERLKGLDYLTFESGSGVRGFFAEDRERKRELLSAVCPVCIGQATRDALREFGVERGLTAESYTADGIVNALVHEREHGRICI